jgi:hypothetical protein
VALCGCCALIRGVLGNMIIYPHLIQLERVFVISIRNNGELSNAACEGTIESKNILVRTGSRTHKSRGSG